MTPEERADDLLKEMTLVTGFGPRVRMAVRAIRAAENDALERAAALADARKAPDATNQTDLWRNLTCGVIAQSIRDIKRKDTP